MQVYQVPGHAFVWLIVAAALAVAPHLFTAPLWLSALVIALLCWRVLVHRGLARLPGRLVRTVILLGAVVGTLYSFGTVLGPEAGVALLIAAFALKLLEMFRLRDAYVAILLCYFVVATGLLLYQNLLMALYVLLALVCTTAALTGVSQAEAGVRVWRPLRTATVLTLQALPLTVVLFLMVPRVAPLWDLPLGKQQARTGISDSMAPGEVSQLSMSRELAFRVEFDGPLPPPRQRYWRGLTYERFDGRRWSQIDSARIWFPPGPRPDWVQALAAARTGESHRYRVIQEPSGRRWLFTLGVPFTEATGIGIGRDYRLVSEQPLHVRRAFEVESWPTMPRALALDPWERERNLQLPPASNPRAAALARQWRAEAGSDAAFIQRVLGWFNQAPFHYTLEPPRLDSDPVDGFLFGTRRGFCEHYASSMAFMLRAAGIPARIVAGYQGGEPSRVGDHLLIHQYDAHAWVEAWLPQEGWREFDPTAMVAPERIEFGLREALAGGAGAAEVFGGLVDMPLLTQLRHLADYMEYSWARWVLGYDSGRQRDLLRRWLGSTDPLRVGIALAAAVLGLMLVMGLWMLWRTRQPGLSWQQKDYWQLYRLLERHGVALHPALDARGLAREAARQRPALATLLDEWARRHEALVYAADGDAADAAARDELRQARRVIRRAL